MAKQIFRYPGAKTRMLNVLRPYFDHFLDRSDSYAEPFVGGGSTLLDVAARHPNVELFVNDFDPLMAAFWDVIASSDSDVDQLCEKLDVVPTLTLYDKLRSCSPKTLIDRAFAAVILNRCSFSGYLTGGPLGGRHQTGEMKIHSRYNAASVIGAVQHAHRLLGGRLLVSYMDGTQFVRLHRDAPMYIDPPYYQKGKLLYRCSMTPFEHALLADELQSAENWVLSYDDCPEIRRLYSGFHLTPLPVKYPGTRDGNFQRKASELIITPAGNFASVAGREVGCSF